MNNNMNITASYIISGQKNSKKNPATIAVTVMKDDSKVADINLVYVDKKWEAASPIDLFNFMACISGGAPVARLEDYINAVWKYAFTCNKYAGQRARKWDIVKF